MIEALSIPVRAEVIRYEAKGVLSLTLHTLDGSALPPVEAGAHIDLEFGNGVTRQYSLVRALDTSRYVIGVARDANGRGGSKWLHDDLRIGAELKITGLRNAFALDDGNGPVALYAGGIGVTPILSMIEALEAKGREWTAFYACRERDCAAFLDDLSRYGERVIYHFDSEAGTIADLKAEIAKVPAGAHLYCCGPEPMLNAFEAACDGRPEAEVHLERFGVKPLDASVEGSFEVEFRKSGKTVLVAADQTILDAAKSVGVSIEYSCENGVCGTCEVNIIDGEPDHRDMILDEKERASGKTMMVCCSRSKSPKLVLNV